MSGEATVGGRVRIGIDVGGTFTHAVAVDAATLELRGKAKVPTTHDAADGVARGVVNALHTLLADSRIAPADVQLIAHSTTQATNALLEGDVAPVGIVGMARGPSAALARMQTAIAPITLAPRRVLAISHRFIRSERVDPASIDAAIDGLLRDGAQVIVAAEAFSVDDPSRETLVCERAAARGLIATATHHVSRLHGLRIRTRTAVINASMLPRMLRTAEMTDRAVRESDIRAPLMIMRSDGGIMTLAEMRRRPILTMLSGPAAGVAAALLYARVSDGVFLEVGGTSTDISVIRNGRCQVRSAEIGGQKLHVATLDVRTVGVAGGSLAYLRDDRIEQVGPRSAHIAGLPYLSFMEGAAESLRADAFEFEGDRFAAVMSGPSDRAASDRRPAAMSHGDKARTGDSGVTTASSGRWALTPTCAANLMGLVPDGDPARGNRDAIEAGFAALAAATSAGGPRESAQRILDLATDRVILLIEDLLRDYRLDRDVVRLVGGGGAASAIVPHVAKRMELPFSIVPNADVISAIGVALALVRDTIERTVISPRDDDIRRIRQEAFESVLKMGAAPESIEVVVEVDARRNLLRATAEGATDIRRHEREDAAGVVDQAERARLVAASMGPGPAPTREQAAGGFELWAAERERTRLWRFGRERRRAVRVLDRRGVIRWQSSHADFTVSTAAAADRDLEALAERHTRYSDAGATIPRCFALLGGRIINLAGLVEMKQVLEVLRLELARVAGDESCLLLVEPPGTS